MERVESDSCCSLLSSVLQSGYKAGGSVSDVGFYSKFLDGIPVLFELKLVELNQILEFQLFLIYLSLSLPLFNSQTKLILCTIDGIVQNCS